jgi:hypothetical protein
VLPDPLGQLCRSSQISLHAEQFRRGEEERCAGFHQSRPPAGTFAYGTKQGHQVPVHPTASARRLMVLLSQGILVMGPAPPDGSALPFGQVDNVGDTVMPQPENGGRTMSSSSDAAIDTMIREFFKAWDRRDADHILSCFTDDGIYHNTGMAPLVGTVPREIQCGSKCTIRVEPAARHIGGFSEPWSYSSGEDP